LNPVQRPTVFINGRLRDLVKRDDALLVYPHTQRTGGVTIRRKVLVPVYGKARVYDVHYVANAKPWRALTDEDLRGYRAYTGLKDYRPIEISRPCILIAVLRHPLYRAVSLYHYVKKKQDHGHHEMAKQLGMDEFYSRAIQDKPEYYLNLQCKRICGRPDSNQALKFVRASYFAVGFTNYLSEFVQSLGKELGWPPLDVESGPEDAGRYEAQISEGFRELVLRENAEDLALYNAMTRGAI
jgi:hypothetical protein